MKLIVDKMPTIPKQCLFATHLPGGNGWICSIAKGVPACVNTEYCPHLKEQKKEERKPIHTYINKCLCGSKHVELIIEAGSGLYFVRCSSCENESDRYTTPREAIAEWNADNNDEPYTPYIYQIDATRTADPALSAEKKILEGLVGINSEAGEALDIWKKYEFHKHDLDKKAIALELGDVLWYLTEAAVALGYSLEDVMKMNIEKLENRYPNGFDPERSKNREE